MHINGSQKISIQGIQLEIQRVSGTGTASQPTLVFLHEGLGSVAMWRDWPAQLCQRLGCAGLVYSRRGYGQSDAVPDVRGPSDEADGQRVGRLLPDYMHEEALVVLPALLRALGIERPVLLGHSDGGTIALIHASHFEVAGCVVMAPHMMVEDISIAAITAARDAFENGPLRQRLSAYHADVDCAFWQWNDVWLSEAFRSFDIRPELGEISAPLLAIQGDADPYGTMAQIDEIAQAVPHARLLKLPDCGHSPHRDQPEAVAQAIEAFMAQVRA
ncbi:alpha/beta hydrolase [Limnohabitans sp. 2KL-1]|uniref:alpha/beta fold hydrolase n=1 Tax=Limnohabitans sp. 2KL-1 TaxID=1100699 RepID=UPI000D367AA8|nr:alpha/beta hydrolase [Limnohabitans sp. 2KL-1]PUE47846.1 alpha/beta hydrolase [Limnohabitans sp. 2KL-1]